MRHVKQGIVEMLILTKEETRSLVADEREIKKERRGALDDLTNNWKYSRYILSTQGVAVDKSPSRVTVISRKLTGASR